MNLEQAQQVKSEIVSSEETRDGLAMILNDLMMYCHGNALASGWWHERDGSPKDVTNKDFIAAKIALMHSELSEALEAWRKDQKDDHLPQYDGIAVEFADAIVRILDTAGALGLPIGDALADKLRYNATRADHKPENRNQPGGKSI